jgi:hypothetical protein
MNPPALDRFTRGIWRRLDERDLERLNAVILERRDIGRGRKQNQPMQPLELVRAPAQRVNERRRPAKEVRVLTPDRPTLHVAKLGGGVSQASGHTFSQALDRETRSHARLAMCATAAGCEIRSSQPTTVRKAQSRRGWPLFRSIARHSDGARDKRRIGRNRIRPR